MATKTHTLRIDGVDIAIKDVNALKDQLGKLEGEFSKAGSGAQKLNNAKLDKLKGTLGGLKSGIGNISKEFLGAASASDLLTQATSKLGIENDYLNKAISLFGSNAEKGFGKAGTASTKFGSMLKGALASTGIGLLIIAITSVVAYMNKTQEGADKLGRGMAYLQGIFTGVTNKLAGLGKEIVDFIEKALEDPTVIIDALVQNLTSRVQGLAKVAESLFRLDFKGVADGAIQIATGVENATDKVVGLSEELNAAGNAAANLKTLEQQFEQLTIKIEDSNAALKRQMEGYEKIYSDANKSTKDREAAFVQANKLEDQLFANKVRLAQSELNLVSQRNKLEDRGREGQREAAKAEQALADVRNQIKLDEIEDQKFLTGLRKEDAKILITEKKEQLQALIAANEAELASTETTMARKLELNEQLAKDKTELIKQTLKELELAGNSTAVTRQRIKLEGDLAQVASDAAKQKGKIEEEFSKRDAVGLERFKKAALERKKLEAEQLTDAKSKVAEFTAIADEEIAAIEAKNKEDQAASKFTAEEKKAIEEENSLAIARIRQGLADKTKTILDKEVDDAKAAAEKKKEDEEKAGADRLARIDGMVQSYSALQSAVSDIFNSINQSAVAALDAQLAGINSTLDQASSRMSDIDSQRQEALANIESLEDSLLTAKGSARDRIIKQLEIERAKEKQLASERKKEDDRIKKAETEKLALEKEKQKTLSQQVIVTQALAISQSLVTALTASTKGKFGWDNLAILIAMTGAVLASISQIKSASKGFADGGYTGDGDKYQEAGVVHKGEYVVPQWMVKANKPLIANLENQRLRGYAEGGMVATKVPTGNITAVSDPAMLSRLDAIGSMLAGNLDKPIYTVASEIADVNARVATIKETALK